MRPIARLAQIGFEVKVCLVLNKIFGKVQYLGFYGSKIFTYFIQMTKFVVF